MATAFIINPDNLPTKARNYFGVCLGRWGERQGGAAFVSVVDRFVMTDYNYDHKEVDLLRHMLNVHGVRYRFVSNINLEDLGKSLWKQAQKINNDLTMNGYSAKL